MPKKRPRAPKRRSAVSEPKVAMNYRLSPERIARAQKILGTPTATATIEEALDMIVFRRELMAGIDRAYGLPIRDAFPDAPPTPEKRRR